jgi:mono/diheme cytochrome c family protein
MTWTHNIRGTRAALAGAVALIALAAACGSSSGGSSSAAPPATTTPPPATSSPPASSSGGGTVSAAAGKTVFQSNCSSCHTLADAGASGSVGPNLDQLKPNMATVVHQVTNGGGGMPAFKGTLSEEEIKNVAAYVVEDIVGGK